MSLVPYNIYKKLSAKDKAAVKSALTANVTGHGAYKKRPATKRSYVKKTTTSAVRPWYQKKWVQDAAMGAAAASLPVISKLVGFGDYAVPSLMPESNSLMAAITANGPPSLQSTSARSHVIRHREYLGDVITASTAAFNITDYDINPGLSTTFPWLFSLASNFEQYRINGMIFEFKSTSADALNSTNTALGTVIMATEYNSDSTSFTTKQQMENHEFASSAKQSCSMLHPIECKRSMTPISELYVRTGTPPSGQDLRLYDLGRFSIATVGQQGASVNIGELWVTYEIEFFKPQLPNLVSPPVSDLTADHFYSAAGVTLAAYFGTVQSVRGGSDLGCTITADAIEFPLSVSSGNYIISLAYYTTGGIGTWVLPAFTPTNCTIVNMWNVGGPDISNDGDTLAHNTAFVTVVVNITGPGAVVTLSAGTLPIPATMDLYIAHVNGSIFS